MGARCPDTSSINMHYALIRCLEAAASMAASTDTGAFDLLNLNPHSAETSSMTCIARESQPQGYTKLGTNYLDSDKLAFDTAIVKLNVQLFAQPLKNLVHYSHLSGRLFRSYRLFQVVHYILNIKNQVGWAKPISSRPRCV